MLIALSIFAFLLMIAGPQYADFMGNMQIRNAAENTLTGVRLAQAEADSRQCAGAIHARSDAVQRRLAGQAHERRNRRASTLVQSYTFADGACKTTPSTRSGGATR